MIERKGLHDFIAEVAIVSGLPEDKVNQCYLGLIKYVEGHLIDKGYVSLPRLLKIHTKPWVKTKEMPGRVLKSQNTTAVFCKTARSLSSRIRAKLADEKKCEN